MGASLSRNLPRSWHRGPGSSGARNWIQASLKSWRDRPRGMIRMQSILRGSIPGSRSLATAAHANILCSVMVCAGFVSMSWQGRFARGRSFSIIDLPASALLGRASCRCAGCWRCARTGVSSVRCSHQIRVFPGGWMSCGPTTPYMPAPVCRTSRKFSLAGRGLIAMPTGDRNRFGRAPGVSFAKRSRWRRADTAS